MLREEFLGLHAALGRNAVNAAVNAGCSVDCIASLYVDQYCPSPVAATIADYMTATAGAFQG